MAPNSHEELRRRVKSGGGAAPAVPCAPAEQTHWLARWKALERREIMCPLQRKLTAGWFKASMLALGESCTGDGLVVFFAVLNWCVSHRWGTEGIWLVPVAEILNGLIKWSFASPRPGWVDPAVQQMGKSHEFSFPSSHSMISFSLAVYFAGVTGSALPYLFAGLVAFSRVYEGMHYPHDVVVGSLLGLALGSALSFILAEERRTGTLAGLESSALVALGGAFTALTGLAVAVVYRRARDTPVPAEWAANVAGALKGEALQPLRVPLLAYIGMLGVLFGLTVGETLFYRHGDKFPMPASVQAGLARVVSGLAVLLGCFFAVRVLEKLVQPHSTALALGLRFLRFFQVPPIILLVAPPLFAALGI